jgi:hypothetical protein
MMEQYFPAIWEILFDPIDSYEKNMEDTYNDLIEPMSALRGLKSFFVHLNWKTSYGVLDKGVPDGRQKVEGKLERMVMGEEYDAWKCGKDVRYDLTSYDY